MEESSGSPSGPLCLKVVRTREEKSSGAWVAGRNRTGSVHWAGLHVHVLGVCLKGRKLSAEVEGRQAKPGAARSLPPFSLPPASQPASRPASQSVDQSVSQPASQPSLRDVLSACPELSAGEPWIQQILSTHYVPGTVLGPGKLTVQRGNKTTCRKP